MEIFKISELSEGMIIWFGNTILGITGSTLPEEFYNMLCIKVKGNKFDYQLLLDVRELL